MKSVPAFLLMVAGVSAFAAVLSAAEIPEAPIAKKGELLFSDDFSAEKRDERWVKVVDTFTVEEGALKGTQTRVKDVVKDGKVTVKAHAAVHGLNVPSKDSIVECRIKLDGASMVDVELDDRNYTGCHYGHICRAQVRIDPKTKKGSVVLIDEKDGGMRNDIYEMKNDPSKKAEVAKLLVGRSATFPVEIEAGKWYNLGVEILGEEMRVTLDGKAVGYLKSSGIAHATKTRYEFGVAGQSGYFDDLKVYKAEAK